LPDLAAAQVYLLLGQAGLIQDYDRILIPADWVNLAYGHQGIPFPVQPAAL
jgi:hypothetical protein